MTPATVFDRLYSTHAARVRRIAASMVAGRDVDDLCQEIWLRIWTEISADPRRETSRSWIDTIATDTCRRHRRDTARRQTVPIADHHMLTTEQIEDRLDLERLISHLSPTQQQIVRLHYVDGYTVSEIANRLSLPPGTVKSHLYRARRKMKGIAKK